MAFSHKFSRNSIGFDIITSAVWMCYSTLSLSQHGMREISAGVQISIKIGQTTMKYNILLAVILIGSIHHIVLEESDVKGIVVTIQDTDGLLVASSTDFIERNNSILASIKIPEETEPGEYIQRVQIDTGNEILKKERIIKLEKELTWWQKILNYLRLFLP